ncbi:isoflavone reductase homolog A622-like [Lactuca sativa]|uniref:isoflavone reductase homolog A622-like n=1 Tax=Lactuca sativa TaxID=4236 RepID=UPI0022AF024F|nr:isoflavone reductase homolog A622-like [Lactuca sativa]
MASKILIIGGTGYIGRYLVEASLKEGHPTFILTRPTTTKDDEKTKLLDDFESRGVELVYGDLDDYEKLLEAVKKVDVVISTVSGKSAAAQDKLIEAIKEAGNVKRFLPSEFGLDVDHGILDGPVDPAKSIFEGKAKIRRKIEAENIPHTLVVCNGFAKYFLPKIGLMKTEKEIIILGNGNVKVVFVKEEDIALITIKTVDDPRTLNKALIFRPPGNTMSFNEVVSIWESKIGKTFDRIYVTDEEALKEIEDSPGKNIMSSISYSTFIKGSATSFIIEPSFGVEASELYPDVNITTIEKYLDEYV